MTFPVLAVRAIAAATLGLLAGCAALAPQPAPEAAYVVLGENGAPVARVLTTAASCPAITLDGQGVPMAVRVPSSPIVQRAARKDKLVPQSSAILTCEAPVPGGTRQASVAGQALPLPKQQLERIVVIGDTGCRLNKNEAQDCNDPKAYPFATIAEAAARFGPDLVLHVGDYHYREDPCPAGRAGCAGSPFGYTWDVWNADFFTPARALLRAAPWVLARGNHESCVRAGQGYWRFIDPRPLAPRRDCNDPADDAVGDYSDPYAVPLGGGAQLIVFDTANTTYKGLKEGDPRLAIYGDNYRKIAQLARNASYNIAVDHHPMFAFGALQDKNTGAISLFGGDAGLLQSFGAQDPLYLPESISMLLSGHVHLWEQLSFSSRHPTQFVSGFSGTAEDIVPLPEKVAPGVTPAPGAVVEHMSSWIDGFGYMTMERTGTDAWSVKIWDRDGRERNSCQVKGRRSVCALGQVH
jgi:hypothetical protein